MAKVFLNYRREDSPYAARFISDKLVDSFGQEEVVFDVESIPLGVDFEHYLTQKVKACDVLVSVIGNHWLEELNERLDDEQDYVRIELRAALARGVPVIPILVDRARVPTRKELPADLQALSRMNGTEVRPGRDLRNHLDDMVVGLQRTLTAWAEERQEMDRLAEEVEKPKVLQVEASDSKTGYSGIEGHVYISHATEDREAAERIRSALEAAGITAVTSPEHAFEDAASEEALKSIARTSAFVPVISRATTSPDRRWFRKEWNDALRHSEMIADPNAFILPVVIDDTPFDADNLPMQFRQIQWGTAPDGMLSPELLETVARAYRRYQ